MFKKLFLLIVLSINTTLVCAHGLSMTTASVMIRNQNHLLVRVQYDPVHFFNRYEINKKQSQQKKLSITALANMNQEQLKYQYDRLKTIINNKLTIKVDNQKLQSLHFRFPKLATFKSQIREQFMQQVMSQGNSHDDLRRYYQILDIDSFLPKNSNNASLMIDFPSELGEIMVTFSEPKTQVLKPDAVKSHYQIKINSPL